MGCASSAPRIHPPLAIETIAKPAAFKAKVGAVFAPISDVKKPQSHNAEEAARIAELKEEMGI